MIYLVAGILGIVYSRRLGLASIFGKAFVSVGGGLISYGIAQFVWVFYNVFSNVEVPYPSVADIFYLLFYTLTFLGFIFLLQKKR